MSTPSSRQFNKGLIQIDIFQYKHMIGKLAHIIHAFHRRYVLNPSHASSSSSSSCQIQVGDGSLFSGRFYVIFLTMERVKVSVFYCLHSRINLISWFGELEVPCRCRISSVLQWVSWYRVLHIYIKQSACFKTLFFGFYPLTQGLKKNASLASKSEDTKIFVRNKSMYSIVWRGQGDMSPHVFRGGGHNIKCPSH